MSKNKSRSFIRSFGNFVAVPDAFKSAPRSLQNLLKFEVEAARDAKSEHPLKLETFFYTDAVLLDLLSFDAGEIDFDVVLKDLLLVTEIVNKDSKKISQMLAAFQKEPEGYKQALKVARDIGLTEDQFVNKGGGVLALIVVLIVALAAAGCESGCATTRGAERRDLPDEQ